MNSVLRVRSSPPLRGVCRVPGDKSISHRALLFGALADGVVEAEGLGRGGDNLSTAAALRALGVDIQLDGDGDGGGRARIAGVGFAGLRAAAEELDCGNSGTTIRLLMGLLAGRPFETRPLRRRLADAPADGAGRDAAAADGRADRRARRSRAAGGHLPAAAHPRRIAEGDRVRAEGRQRAAEERADPGGAAGQRPQRAARARPVARSHRAHAGLHGRADFGRREPAPSSWIPTAGTAGCAPRGSRSPATCPRRLS